jgi:hypothetical protein
MSRLSAATVRLIAAARASYSDDPVDSRKLDFLLTSASRPSLLRMLHRATSDNDLILRSKSFPRKDRDTICGQQE